MTTLYSISLRRPVLAIVLSLVITLFGVISYFFLPVRELPSVDPPVITVTTTYAGASPEIIDNQITETLESSINAVDGIKKLSSSSREGMSRITVEFGLGVDMERAANDVRDRIGAAIGRLPADADPPRVVKSHADAGVLVALTVSSPIRSMLELTEIATVSFAERLQTIEGVSTVDVVGERRYAMRIWLDPQRLAAYRMTPLDIQEALRTQNVELPSGRIEGGATELIVKTMSRLSTPEEFEQLILRQRGASTVRLRDVAQVSLGARREEGAFKRDGVQMVALFLRPQPGANHITVVDEFHRRVDAIRRELPSDIQVEVGFDNTRAIRASIREVKQTIFVAVGLVVLIIFAFLREWRTTLVPVTVIPVSLIGAFFVMYLAGFSINVLTLLAIVLAVGLVVDDAIVVLENIYRQMEAGKPPMVAGEEGTREIVFAVIATTLTLVAVFLPILFLSGITGRLFREFGVVLAGAVVISSFAALTLAPMLSVRLLRRTGHSRLYEMTEPWFQRLTASYAASLDWLLHRRWLAVVGMIAAAAASVALWRTLPSELAPLEDRSLMRLMVTAPEGVTSDYMVEYMDALRDAAHDATPEAYSVVSVTPNIGSPTPNSGVVLVILRPKDEREASQQQIARRLAGLTTAVPGARAFVAQPPTISRGGNQNSMPVQFALLAPSFSRLEEVLPEFLRQASAQPALGFVDVDLKLDRPEIRVEIDRERALSLGISVRDIAQTMQLALSGLRYGYFIRDGRQYEVIGQVRRENREEPVDLNALYVRSSTGEPVPLGNLVRFTEHVGPTQLFRFNRYISATVSGQLAPGYTMSEGIAAMRQVADEVLDDSFATALDGQAADFVEGASSLLFLFGLAVALVYLVLAAQFESFREPLTIMLTVPLAVSGAVISLWYFGQTLNVFSQIGIIMLVGLVTKHGILIVEFANQRKAAGLSRDSAIREASAARFRPILMTALSTMLGVMPIAFSLGAGSESRVPMGVAVVGGMFIGTVLSLYFIPALYTFVSASHRAEAAAPHRSSTDPHPDRARTAAALASSRASAERQ